MNDNIAEFKRRTFVQIAKINVDKWDEGVKTNKDPGVKFVIKWIKEQSCTFNNKWLMSYCRTCQKYKECGFKLALVCKYHKPEQEEIL
jgi:hypothetical protein